MAEFLKQSILFIIEWCFKLTASLAAVISLGVQGGLLQKIAEGFASLPEAIRQIIWWIQNISQIGNIVNDYNTLTAASFNQKYGSGAVNYVMDYLNEGVTYLQQVYTNLAADPLITILAAVIVFLTFYLIAWLSRFTRQKGQGSVITKFERRVGDRIFKRRDYIQDDSSLPHQD